MHHLFLAISAQVLNSKRLWIVGIVLWFGLLSGCKPAPVAIAPSGPIPVTVGVPIEREVQDYEEFTGRVSAKFTVEVRARVTGYLDKIGFEDGTEVKEGDLLFVIDPRPFKAQYDSVVTQVAVNKANLAFREAEMARYKELIKTKSVSQSDFEQVAASYEQAKASVIAAEANTEGAKLNLAFTHIHAAISGRISSKNIDIGNLVVADQTLLTTIVSVDPINVKFDVDERRLLRIQQQVREGKIKIQDGLNIPLEMALDNEKGFPHKGWIYFADNRIDQNTGTIQLRGVFPNPLPTVGKRVLVPGMFARVRVPLGDPRAAVLIAEQALGSDQGQRFVFIVDSKKEVQYRRVTTGKVEAGLRVIEAGLRPGEQVIVGGLQRVQPGVVVEPKPVEMASYASPISVSPASK